MFVFKRVHRVYHIPKVSDRNFGMPNCISRAVPFYLFPY